MKYQGFLCDLFQISAVKWLCELKSFISFKLTFTVLPGYLNFSVADATTNVADVTLCESLLSIEDKSAFLYCIVVFSLVWPPDAKCSLKLKFRHQATDDPRIAPEKAMPNSTTNYSTRGILCS